MAISSLADSRRGYDARQVQPHHVGSGADALAERFTLVMPDLRGYGDSSKPKGDADHGNYSKRAMAQDMVEVMSALGHNKFHLVESVVNSKG